MPANPIPDWAESHLQQNLPAGTTIVNATTIGSRRVLANTKRGAVLVRKSFFGGVQHVFLEVPQARVHFPCSRCGESVQLFTTRPQTVRCAGCNAPYVMAANGAISDSMGVQVRVHRTAESAPASAPMALAIETTPAADDVFTYNGYTLHVRHTANGSPQYFFAKAKPKSGVPCAMPAGYEVGANSKTGLPFLRRSVSTPTRSPPKKAAPSSDDGYHPQCSAITTDGSQCRNSTRGSSKYCASHKGYQPPGARKLAQMLDTTPANDVSDDALLSVRGRSTSIIPGEQCLAITAAGAQCRNTSRTGSKYCPSHRSYQPPTARLVAARRDTQPRVKGAPDTLPTVRKTTKR
ncbi:MAG: hypothetical protein V4510_00790 [bacterium]